MLTDITEAERRTETLPDDVLLLEIPVNEQNEPDILERAQVGSGNKTTIR